MHFIVGIMIGLPLIVFIGAAVQLLVRAAKLYSFKRHWLRQLEMARIQVSRDPWIRPDLIRRNYITRVMVLDEFLPNFSNEIPSWANGRYLRIKLEVHQDMDYIMLILFETRRDPLQIRFMEREMERERLRQELGPNISIEEEFFKRNPVC